MDTEETIGGLLATTMDWEDVVLDKIVMQQVEEIKQWTAHARVLMEDDMISKKMRPGYRALFYGPPGTGKKLTVTLIGKTTGHKVYIINLSVVLAKSPAETENVLAGLFEKAASENWILFFEGADVLLDKLANGDQQEANQQIAHLLQRIEEYPGLVVLAANIMSKVDEAFARRFQAVIHFTMPSADERYRLWKDAFSGTCKPAPEIDVRIIAEEYELTGGAIVNILRYYALTAVNKGNNVITREELIAGIKRELKS
jgi:SpoVK/Ycf46/Vps4 family AAA+-type ATPase